MLGEMTAAQYSELLVFYRVEEEMRQQSKMDLQESRLKQFFRNVKRKQDRGEF